MSPQISILNSSPSEGQLADRLLEPLKIAYADQPPQHPSQTILVRKSPSLQIRDVNCVRNLRRMFSTKDTVNPVLQRTRRFS